MKFDKKKPGTSCQYDLNNSVFVSLSGDYVMYSLSYVGSHDLISQWPAVHNKKTKQRCLNRTFKTRCCTEDTFIHSPEIDESVRIGDSQVPQVEQTLAAQSPGRIIE